MSNFKAVTAEISYAQKGKSYEVVVTRKAKVCFGEETGFGDIENFLNDLKKVIRGYKQCVKNQLPCKVYLAVGIYEKVPNDINQLSFDGWNFEGVPMAGDVNGLYLAPDLRYTAEEHDIYIDFSKDLLGQLAQAHI